MFSQGGLRLDQRLLALGGKLPPGCCGGSTLAFYLEGIVFSLDLAPRMTFLNVWNGERLGYTIFVQSPLSQPLVHRNKVFFEKIAKEHNTPVLNLASEQGKDDIRRVEGILIEAFRAHYGDFPAWNKVGGDTIGQHRVLPNNINIVKSFANPQEYKRNPIVSRSTIRELAENADYELFECNYLHTARMFMFTLGMDYEEALDLVDMFDRFGYREKMIQFGYDKKKLIV